jgi:glycerophosphoryl diester phosphodiesterase
MRNHSLVAAITVGLFGLGLAAADQAKAVGALNVVGHRGAQSTSSATENGTKAVAFAMQRRAGGVEVDVRLTRDGRQIVMHDKTLDRTTNCTGEVAKRTYADIRENCRLDSGQKIPNVYEIAWTFSKYDSRGDRLWLHVKFEASSKQRSSLFKAVDKYGLRTKTVILQDEDDMLEDFAKWSGIERALIFNAADVAQGGSESWTAGFDYAVPYRVPVTAALVTKARKAGSKVYGVESGLSLSQAQTLGLDGFVANDVAGALR